jgi:hypothetical protein
MAIAKANRRVGFMVFGSLNINKVVDSFLLWKPPDELEFRCGVLLCQSPLKSLGRSQF